jgi:hypothetical protein
VGELDFGLVVLAFWRGDGTPETSSGLACFSPRLKKQGECIDENDAEALRNRLTGSTMEQDFLQELRIEPSRIYAL